MKKVLTLVTCISLLFSDVTYVVFAQSVDIPEVTEYNLELENQDYNFTLVETEERNEVWYTSSGVEHHVVFHKNTGELYLDGGIIGIYENTITPFAWVEASRKNGTIGTAARDVGAVAAALVAICGGPATAAAVIAIASVVVGNAYDEVYYTKITYYDDSTLHLQRPKMKMTTIFYSDSARKREIGRI